MYLGLPTLYVYVYYNDNTRECVGIQDDLPVQDAQEYYDLWKHKGHITAVTLETKRGSILESYTFVKQGD